MNETKDKTTKEDDVFLLLGIVMAFAAMEGVDLESNEPPDERHSSLPSSNATSSDGNQNTLGVKTFVKDKAIEMYAKKTVENLKKNLKSSEPFVLGSMNKETIKDSDYNLTFQLSKVKIYNLGALEVKKFKSTSEKNMIEFTFGIPFIKLTSDYDVNGTFQKKSVKGKGDCEIQVKDVSIENGRIVVKETPEEIQIQDISLCYDFKDMTATSKIITRMETSVPKQPSHHFPEKFINPELQNLAAPHLIKQTGLSIDGVEPNNVTNMLSSVATKYLKENKQKICNRIAAEIKTRSNAQLKGKTRDQLGEMMK